MPGLLRASGGTGVLGMAVLAACLGWACHHGAGPSNGGGPEATLSTDALPALKLTDETQHLLLTWVSEDGDFHVAETIGDVPVPARKQVRVVVTDPPMGTSANVYVADLTLKGPDGSYAVSSLPRTDWEKIGAERRKTRMEALAPAAPSPNAPANVREGNLRGGEVADSASKNDAEGGSAQADRKITAIVYGADWCKPCHDAERYLKSLGVAVTKKNIEESRAAQAEMQEKLAHINRNGSSIPVIDVMGKIFIGYSPQSLRQAVEAARNAAAAKHG